LDSLFPQTAWGMAVMGSSTMRDYADEVFRQMREQVDVRNMFCMGSDYVPFLLSGVPAGRPADFGGAIPRWSHTRQDIPQNVPPQWIQLNESTFGCLLGRILTESRLPSRRLPADEVRALVDKKKARQALLAWENDVP
jgi:hypothetical protein